MNKLATLALIFALLGCNPQSESLEGQIGVHVLTGERYLVLRDGRRMVRVRTMDGNTETLYKEELFFEGKPLGPIHESASPMLQPSLEETRLENENGVFAERTWNPASGRYE
jgi:uncharacterized lipoprotein NlpE involved in copper resistance